MKQVYLITQGEYDDYHIKEVWDNKERAESRVKFLNSNLGEWDYQCEIEERTLNPATLREVFKVIKAKAVYLLKEGRVGVRGGFKVLKAGEISTTAYEDKNYLQETLPEKDYDVWFYEDRVIVDSYIGASHAEEVVKTLAKIGVAYETEV